MRDERIEQQLKEAYVLKQRGEPQKALAIYLSVLGQDFVKQSALSQHRSMRGNAHTYAGEIYEQLRNFKLAKNHYVQALKINERDSWVWTKVAMIEYYHFRNLKSAKKCFEQAIETRPALTKRTASVAPALAKLAEINFLLHDLQESESLVNAILARA